MLAQAFAAEVKVANMASEIESRSAALAAATRIPPSVNAAFASLAQLLAQANNGPANLASASTMQTLIQSAAQQVGVTLDASVVLGAATILAGVNQDIDALTLTGNSNYLNQVVQIQTVAEGTIAPSLASVAAGTSNINTILAQDTGSALSNQAATASIGTLNLVFNPAVPVQYNLNIFGSTNADATTAYIQGLYHAVLGRAGSSSEVQWWVNGLNNNFLSRAQAAQDFVQSTEHRSQEIDSYYQHFLNRSENTTEQAYWVKLFQAGADENTVVQDILSSAEYQAEHATDANFVQSLYSNILGRAASATELSAVEALLANGVSRQVLTQEFLQSTEADILALAGFFTAYLHRSLDAGASYFIALLQSGQSLGAIQSLILGDPTVAEFYYDGAATVQ